MRIEIYNNNIAMLNQVETAKINLIFKINSNKWDKISVLIK